MQRFRWWLASVLASWALDLMRPEMTVGDDWFEHLAMTFIRQKMLQRREGGSLSGMQ